jgi:hypothetical protein
MARYKEAKYLTKEIIRPTIGIILLVWRRRSLEFTAAWTADAKSQ